MRPTNTSKLIAGLLLVGGAAMAGAQRTEVAQGAQRAIDAAARVQDRSARAQERGSAAQERAGRGSDVAARASRAAADSFRDPSSKPAPDSTRSFFTRLEDLVRANPLVLELIDRVAAVRGEVVSIDPSPAALVSVRKHGYEVIGDEVVEGIDTRYVTLRVPAGTPLKEALVELGRISPETEFAANHIHLQSGTESGSRAGTARLAPSSSIKGPAIGIIDGGVAQSEILPSLAQQGFALGAPTPSTHGTAVASLAAATRRIKSGSPGAPLLVADVYGKDPKGGNSLALARALGWMAKGKVPVVMIGLVGPSNPIVARAVKEAQARGVYVVAPVGNAGAAAPPMFPAAYPGVIAVTGVDRRNRALIEAGRGRHVDFAAPGADILAANTRGRLIKVRGTSYAAPLVAGRLWVASRSDDPLSTLERTAVDLGRPGPDNVFGRGLVCDKCR